MYHSYLNILNAALMCTVIMRMLCMSSYGLLNG